MPDLPTGTVTFLFTDVEGSTRLLQELGGRYADVLADHRRVLREAFARHGGVEVDTQGDAFFVAFARASEALAAAVEARDALEAGPIRVRMGLHTGEPLLTEEGYLGIDVHRAARIAAAGHGGQILVSQSTRDLSGANGLHDLGAHRLKDLTGPERIYQFGEDDFPPLKSLNQTNLPVQPTALVGREHELREIGELLHSSRLLTLTGAGGSGKTRLALQAAAEVVDEFPDGVWFVSLASLTDPELVEATIAQVIGARDDLAQFLRGKRLLLLLDNLEQLLPEVAPRVAHLDASVLATSRERLNVGAEQEYPVLPLPLDDAVALFVQRARQLKPGFESNGHVTEIARRLDGLPLALELAAARVKVLTPAQILERLGHSLGLLTIGARDAPARQRTLRATIEWSHELLGEEERRAFTRLSVFAGSFSADAAEAVCDADLDTLQSLVDRSLLRQTEEARFFMLATIQEFAAERLERAWDEDAIRAQHAQFVARLFERAHPELAAADQAEWMGRLVPELDNLRAALAWARDSGSVEVGLRLVAASWRFWMIRGDLAEGTSWLHEMLHRTLGNRSGDRIEALCGVSYLLRLGGDFGAAKDAALEAVDLSRQLGDDQALGRALRDLGNATVDDHEQARRLFEEAASISRAVGDAWNLSIAINNLGDLALITGDYDRAAKLCAESLELRRQRGDKRGMAISLFNVGWAFLEQERTEDAVTSFREALTCSQELGFKEGLAISLEGLAAAAARCRDAARAARLLGASTRIREETGLSLPDHERRVHARTESTVQDSLAEGAAIAIAEGAAMGADEALAYALSLD